MPRSCLWHHKICSSSFFSRFLWGVVLLLILTACSLLQLSTRIENTPVPVSEPMPFPSSVVATQTSAPAVAITNYQNFTKLISWDTDNVIRITGIALSPDAKEVALITSRYKEKWWLELRDSEKGMLLWEKDLGDKAAYDAIAFSPDGKLVATGLDHGDIKVWNTSDGSLAQKLTGHIYSVRVVAFSPDGQYIASGASDNTARVWQVSNGANLAVYKIKTDVRDIAWSPDSKYLAVTSNYVNVYNVPSRDNHPNVFYDNAGDTKDLGEVAFSPNGIFLIGAGEWLNPKNNRWRYRILVWDFPYNQTAPLKIPLDDAVEDAVISPDGQVLIAVYKDKGKLLLIDIVDREIKGSIDIGPKLYMSYSPDISRFAVVSTNTTVTVWGIKRK